MQTTQNQKTRYMVQLALLIAVQIVLNMTPLGYIPGVLEITTMHLPVVVGAVVLGPLAGAILGTVFGITSIISATGRATPTSFVFSPFISGSFRSVLIAVAPRILMGLAAGLVFQWLAKTKLNYRISAGIAAGMGTFCNTALVLGGIYLLYGEAYAAALQMPYEALLAGFLAVVASNGMLEMLLAVAVAAVLVGPLRAVAGMPRQKQ
jgi:Predicted membrane protein